MGGINRCFGGIRVEKNRFPSGQGVENSAFGYALMVLLVRFLADFMEIGLVLHRFRGKLVEICFKPVDKTLSIICAKALYMGSVFVSNLPLFMSFLPYSVFSAIPKCG